MCTSTHQLQVSALGYAGGEPMDDMLAALIRRMLICNCCPAACSRSLYLSDCEANAGLQIVAASALMAGQEIHNTYGEYGNSELVYKYGFALRDNPFDSVSLDKELLLEKVKSCIPADSFDARCTFLDQFR